MRDPAGLPEGPLREAARLQPDRMLLQADDADDPSQASAVPFELKINCVLEL